MADRLNLKFKPKDVLHADEVNKIVDAINNILEPTNTFGTGTQALNKDEVAMGKYNKSNPNTTFSIGNGTDVDRLNILEVTNNNDIYVNGLGGFAGNNTSTSQSLLTMIRENARRIGILEESGKVIEVPLLGKLEDIKPFEKTLQPGYVFLNTNTNQFMMWNGHNWIILVNNESKPTVAPKVTFDASPMLDAVLDKNTGDHIVSKEFMEKLIAAIDLGIIILIKDIRDTNEINIINVSYAMNDVTHDVVRLILYGANNIIQLVGNKTAPHKVTVLQYDFAPKSDDKYYVKQNGKWVDINEALGFISEALDTINKEII